MVFVGDSTTPIPVHRELIAASSGLFAIVLNGNFRERDGTVRLTDQSPIDFAYYIQWLYSDHFDKEPKAVSWRQMLRLNVLGSFLQDRCFRNATVDALIENTRSSRSFPGILAAPAFEQLPESSPLRKLLVDFWVYQSSLSWFTDSLVIDYDSDTNVAPVEFWIEVTKGLLARSSLDSQRPWDTDRCRYHEHPEGEQRCT